MDDIKLFVRNEKELETLIHAVRINSQDIGMKFGKEKSAMLIMKSVKRHIMDGIGLPNQEKIRTLGKMETYPYLEILEADSIKQVEMKQNKFFKKYFRRTKKLLETIYQEPYYQGGHRRKILGTILEMDQRRTSTNRPENKKKKKTDHA